MGLDFFALHVGNPYRTHRTQMEKSKNETPALKRRYVTPQLFITYLELECSIAAGSATVRTQGANHDVYETWDVEMDDNRRIDF